MNWTLMEVIETTGATPNKMPDENTVLTGISTDTRSLKTGELFVALKGERFDGHAFVSTAASKGAGAILAQDPIDDPIDIPCLFVPDTLRAYGKLANAYRRKLHTRFLAVTGSMGKTSTKEMAAAILSRRYRVAKTEKNENNRVGVPKTLLSVDPNMDTAVIELGSNIPGEIALLTEIVQPDRALLTNIAPVHLEHFRTIEGVRLEKSALFWRSPKETTRCVNRDDPEIEKIPIRSEWPTLGFGTDDRAEVFASRVKPDGLNGTRFTLTHQRESIDIFLPLLGTHQVRNATAAAALAIVEGVPLPDIKAALETFRPPEKRLAPIVTPTGSVIINDTYNANPVATAMALETLAMFNDTYVTVALLGDMLELGEKAGEYHEAIGLQCAKHGIALLGVTGKFGDAILKGAVAGGFDRNRIFFFEDETSLFRGLSPHIENTVMVLVKGSRALKMERYVEALQAVFGEKGRKP